MKFDAKKYPILTKLINEKIVYTIDDEFCGIGSDGTEVGLGNVYYPEEVENYLKNRPSPTQW